MLRVCWEDPGLSGTTAALRLMGDMCLHGKLGVSMIDRSVLYCRGALFEGLSFFETYPGSPWGARCLSAWCFVPWVVDGSPGKPCKVVR